MIPLRPAEINEILGHGIPDSTVLSSGDIVNVDVTVCYNGFHGDCSETFLVGEVDAEASRLVRVTYECLHLAIAICKPGIPYAGIGKTIQGHADMNDFAVFKDGVGHGIGQAFHTTPDVLHFANNVNNGIMREGHVFTIEPMINEGSARGVIWPDGWTAATKDGKRSAQFEHTVLITEEGAEVLTGRLPESNPLTFLEERD
uniref:Methionine aminopeptidase n=1 Tax=Rhodosorus marinus TaxID=101924 RepID=A0A6T6LL45_9RHOD|mmetsp:Transcript_1797/g.2759  ORF Transcript_1797/g.2759 Transcript_1797/m.2759 type:complete len:201 (+) Transcript_1797:93-695(+)